MQNANQDCVYIITGDFNQANLKTVLPHYYQHVDFATRGENTLDWAYTNIKQAFRAVPHPPWKFGQSICYANSSIQTSAN